MKLNELRTKFLKSNHLLTLVGFSTKTSNYSDALTIVFYFVDTQNRLFKHYQIVESETCDLQIRKFFYNLGFNMKDRSPLDLYIDFNTILYRQRGYLEDTILGKALGRVYKGTIVKRKMKWQERNDRGELVTVKKTFFDVDSILYTFAYQQDVLIKQFKEKSIQPCGENVYNWWMGKMFEIQDMEELDYKLYNIKPSWLLKEEELFGSIN